MSFRDDTTVHAWERTVSASLPTSVEFVSDMRAIQYENPTPAGDSSVHMESPKTMRDSAAAPSREPAGL